MCLHFCLEGKQNDNVVIAFTVNSLIGYSNSAGKAKILPSTVELYPKFFIERRLCVLVSFCLR